MRRSLRDVKSRLNAFVQIRVLVMLLVLAAALPAAAQTPPPSDAATANAATATGSRRDSARARGAEPRSLRRAIRPSFHHADERRAVRRHGGHGRLRADAELRRVRPDRMTGAFSFQPEVLFAAKGHRIRDKDAQPVTTPTGELKLPAADRVVLVRYLEFPLLMRLSKRTHENTSVY